MSNATFTAAYDRISNVVEFNPSWKNSTGYLNNAVHDKSITTTSKTIDDFGRKVIIVPTPVGNVVVFERHSNGSSSVVVSNAPCAIEELAFGLDLSGGLGDDALAFYLGDEWDTPNIGDRLDEFFRITKSSMK